MEYNLSKFPVQRPYIKVERNGSSSLGSVGSPDDLSYSYSCIKAFGKNRSIIKNNLNSFQIKNSFLGGHEPLLYSLSGDRDKPICGPFYYSTSLAEVEKQYYSAEKLIKIEEPSSSNLESEYDPIFFDKSNLFDRFKDQVKYLNVLWSFSKSSYINLSKLCKCKNQDVKMEMLLNNIDEKTKTRLKRYLNELNLDLEERCTLFNESTFEINITPILADKSKLQAFLSFLKSIDPSVCSAVEESGTQPFSRLNGKTENKTRDTDSFPTKEIKQEEMAKRRNRQFRNSSADRIKWQNARCHENKDQLFSKDHTAKLKHNEIYGPNLSHQEPSQNCRVRANSPSCFPNEIGLITSFESGNTKPRPIKNQPPGYDNQSSRKPRARFESTLAAKQRSLNSLVDRRQTNDRLEELLPSAVGQSYISDLNCTHADRKLSCKCLIHLIREDYNRYRNQCLFGKGDETSNNFLKYLAEQEHESRCEVHTSSRNEEKVCRNTLDMKHEKYEAFKEPEDECCNSLKKPHKLKYVNNNLKRDDVVDNKLKKVAEQDCTSKSSKQNCYKIYEKIRAGDVEKLVYSINYNDNNLDYNDEGSDNNSDINRSKVNRLTTAQEEQSFDACFESLSYNVAKQKLSANLIREKSKSDTRANKNNAPTKHGRTNSGPEPTGKMEKVVNQDHWHGYHRTKPSGDQGDLQAKRNAHSKNDKNPSVQVLHGNELTNYVDKFDDGISQPTYKELPIDDKNVEFKKRKSLQALGSPYICEHKINAEKESLKSNYSRMDLLDKMSVVIKINKTNDEQIKTRVKEIKSHRTNLSFNSLKPKNLYRNISTIFKRKSSTLSSKSEQAKINLSNSFPSFSEEKLKCRVKEAEPSRSSNLKHKNCCDSISERSDFSEPTAEIPSMLTELLDRLVTELRNQRKEINEMKELLHDQNQQV